MGIYDRDYYRKEGPSFLDYFTTTGQVCKWLVVINVVIFIVQLVTAPSIRRAEDLMAAGSLYGPFTDALAMKPERVFDHFEVWRLLTGAFLHSPSNWQHIVWNMLFLWWFGRDMEDLYGHKEFLSFYLAAGIVSNFLWGVTALWEGPLFELPRHALDHPGFQWIRDFQYPMALGASGAVLAVTILCALHYPFRTILLCFVLPVPFWLFAVIVVAGDLFYFVRGIPIGVACAAHLGGALFAFLYYKLGWRFVNAWATFTGLMRRSGRPRLRVYREEDVAQPAGAVSTRAAAQLDEQLEAKADAILEKVSRQGIGSLTQQERDILQRASEKYKKRRT